ncbi:nucleoside kinase [Salinispira pacifica]
METIRITLPTGRVTEVPVRTRSGEVIAREKLDTPRTTGKPHSPIVATLINNELTSLSYRLEVSSTLVPVTLDTPQGLMIYRRSLCFLLAIAARNILPGRRLIIGHSLGDGYFYHFEDSPELSDQECGQLRDEMRRIVAEDLPIQRRVIAYSEALSYFQKNNMPDTELLLQSRNESKVPVYACGEFMDLSHGPLLPRTSLMNVFDIILHPPGFILRYPSSRDPYSLQPYKDIPVLFSIYQEYKNWGRMIEINSVGRLNRVSRTKKIKDFIWVAEALHNKKIAEIADRIHQRRDTVRVILIAGPSSSGKTTFAKKLSIQLTVMGLRPVAISLDNYFVPREQTPKDENGEYDFENIQAIDIGLLNDNLLGLFRGEEVRLPEFDFRTGDRSFDGPTVQLPDRGVVLMEGIHGLNDQLTPKIAPEQKYRIYVSALTQLNLDDHNRIPTTDNRLIRRLVRDFQFRGHSALETLEMWPSVRRGEDRNIFPYQDSADSAFNSALDYELGVLKSFAEPLLHDVKPHDEVYHEALRLLSFLANFMPIPSHYVPDQSILREFVGGSAFKY